MYQWKILAITIVVCFSAVGIFIIQATLKMVLLHMQGKQNEKLTGIHNAHEKDFFGEKVKYEIAIINVRNNHEITLLDKKNAHETSLLEKK